MPCPRHSAWEWRDKQGALELDTMLSEITRSWDKQELSNLLGASGVLCGPVNTLVQAFEHPQAKHRGIRMDAGPPGVRQGADDPQPLRFSATPPQYRVPPALGADTEDVLREELVIDASAFGKLKEAGLV